MRKLTLFLMLLGFAYGSPRSALIPEMWQFEHRGEQLVAVSMRCIFKSGGSARSPILVGERELVKRFDASVGWAGTAIAIPLNTPVEVGPDGRNWTIVVKGVSFVTSDSKVYRLTQNIGSQPELRVLCDASFKEASQETLYQEIQKALVAE